MARFIAIGDIHGCRVALKGLLRELKLRTDDMLIFLGDYIDRGEDSPGVLDDVLHLMKQAQVIALRGNHEQMMRGARFCSEQWHLWITNGGRETLAAYGIKSPDRKTFRRQIPDRHWNLLDKTLVDYFETDYFIFAHGGLEPTTPLHLQPLQALQWMRFHEVRKHYSGKPLVCGHTAAPMIRMKAYGCCIDTGMGVLPNGLLTALDMTNRMAYQADRQGNVKTTQVG